MVRTGTGTNRPLILLLRGDEPGRVGLGSSVIGHRTGIHLPQLLRGYKHERDAQFTLDHPTGIESRAHFSGHTPART